MRLQYVDDLVKRFDLLLRVIDGTLQCATVPCRSRHAIDDYRLIQPRESALRKGKNEAINREHLSRIQWLNRIGHPDGCDKRLSRDVQSPSADRGGSLPFEKVSTSNPRFERHAAKR